jgi:hypothetical protein
MAKLGAVCVSGVDRLGNPKENQDFVLFNETNKSTILMCADGAGSSKFGAQGSRFLTKKINLAFQSFETDITLESFKEKTECTIHQVRQIFKKYLTLKKLDLELKEFSSTLLFVFIQKNKTYLAHLGDGAALFLDDANNVAAKSLPQNGEYANQTYFFTNENWRDHLRITEIDQDYSTCFIMTDGVTPFVLKKNDVFLGFISPLVDFIKVNNFSQIEIALSNTLCSSKSLSISTDDKSFGWYMK